MADEETPKEPPKEPPKDAPEKKDKEAPTAAPKEQPEVDEKVGVPTETKAEPEKSQIDVAKEIVDSMEKQNKIFAENIKRAEKLSAEQLLGGVIPAGKEATQEEKEIAAARELIKGTGFEDLLFPEKKDEK